MVYGLLFGAGTSSKSWHLVLYTHPTRGLTIGTDESSKDVQ